MTQKPTQRRMGALLSRAAPRAALALALGLTANALHAAGEQQRWVYGPNGPAQCGSVQGYPNLHAALEGVDPTRPVTIHVSAAYRHTVPSQASDPRVRITAEHAASGGRVRIVGGRVCAGGVIQPAVGGVSSVIEAVEGGRILLVNGASRVELFNLEFRGARGAPGAVHPAVHVVGSNASSTEVLMSGIVVADNHAPQRGAMMVANARVDIAGSAFRDNRGGSGAALFVGSNAVVGVSGTRFERNASSGSGGALMISTDGSGIGARVLLEGGHEDAAPGVVFEGNTAAAKGGAIEVGALTELEVIGAVRFDGNQAQEGGAIAVNLDAGSASPRLLIWPAEHGGRPQFMDNRAGLQGGAVHCATNDAAARNRDALALGPALFQRNEAGHRGGALHLAGCKLTSLPGPGALEFFANRVTVGTVDPSDTPAPRGGGALFATRASVLLATQGEFKTEFAANRVERSNGFWGRTCGNQYCVLRALSGGAIMLFDADGQIFDATFADNLAPNGGAISAVDARLTVDQSTAPCGDPLGCSRFLRNRATGAAYIESEAAAGRARRGYGAAIAVRNDSFDPQLGPRHVRIQRSRFIGHGSGCPAGMSCALDPQRIMRGRVVQANLRGDMVLRLRGNVFADNTQADDVATSAAQADDADVSAFSRPIGATQLPVILVANTHWKDPAQCAGAPWLLDVRDSGSGSPRGVVDSAANLLLGCSGGRVFTQPSDIDFRTYACNIADGPMPAAEVFGHNQWQPARPEFFVDPASGDYRLRSNVYGNVSTDVCGPEVAGQSISRLFDGLDRDLSGQPRPITFGGGLAPEAGTWDVGAYERRAPALPTAIFASGFE